MKILVTGASGFIAGYLIADLLDAGHEVVGIDNFSKYGRVEKSYDQNPRYKLVEGDAKNAELMKTLLMDCDHFVACAAMIGGISYFHAFAYDLLAENERITAASFDAAIHAFKNAKLQKVTVLSSSMVFESTDKFPTPESALESCPPPRSTYGFQKLATEYFAKGAFEQYGLPYTIARPFNCVGIGEKRALRDADVVSGNVKLAMSHVVPDLVQKVLKGQDPLHVLGSGNQVRHYTYGGDLARGIRLCIEHPAARNEDFNLSTPVATPVLELGQVIWKKINNGTRPFRYVSDNPYEYDVQMRSPDVSKAEKLLGFKAETSLSEILDEVIPWIGIKSRMSTSNPNVATQLESELQQTYARRFEGQELRRKQVWEVLCGSFFSRWVRPQDTVLDLGAGYCEFINSIQAGKKLALDLNPATATHAAPGVAVISQDICKPWEIASASVDVVFTSNFFEHLENKQGLVHCMKEIRRVLKPGGHFIAMGPNIKYAYKVYWDYFDHYLPLSDRSMVEGLEINGFKLEEVVPRFLPFTMKGSMPSHPALVRLYLAFPLAWRIMGQQFLIVART